MQKVKLKVDHRKHKKGEEIIVDSREAKLLFKLKIAEKPKKNLKKEEDAKSFDTGKGHTKGA